MKYPKEYLDEIKLRLKVSQVVGKYVKRLQNHSEPQVLKIWEKLWDN